VAEEAKLETVRRVLDLVNEGLPPAPGPEHRALFTEDAEIVPVRAALESTSFGLSEWFAEFAESWSRLAIHAEELRPVGPHVCLRATMELVGRESGAPVAVSGAAGIFFAGERIRRWRWATGGTEDEAIAELRRAAIGSARLYFVCDGLPGGGPPDELLDSALRGGVDVIQLREKSPRCAEELVAMAEPFRRAADEHGALFILNDRPDLVAETRADGVHVGQDDAPVAEARVAAGPGALVGLSTHSAEQIDAACSAEDAARPDQISVGPVWETPTKPGRPATGLQLVEHAAQRATIPWFAIGGIDMASIPRVVEAGAARAVVVRAIRDADDPQAAARALRDFLAAREI
jgi:thiamine-phosphate pyrophosphorylase